MRPLRIELQLSPSVLVCFNVSHYSYVNHRAGNLQFDQAKATNVKVNLLVTKIYVCMYVCMYVYMYVCMYVLEWCGLNSQSTKP